MRNSEGKGRWKRQISKERMRLKWNFSEGVGEGVEIGNPFVCVCVWEEGGVRKFSGTTQSLFCCI